MLNGVGGRTVAEAMQTLTLAELNLWQRYRKKTGSFNIALRNEIMLAQLAMLFASANGAKNIDFYDFSPNIPRPEMTMEQFFSIHSHIVERNNGK